MGCFHALQVLMWFKIKNNEGVKIEKSEPMKAKNVYRSYSLIFAFQQFSLLITSRENE
jgi:hypothetical protein